MSKIQKKKLALFELVHARLQSMHTCASGSGVVASFWNTLCGRTARESQEHEQVRATDIELSTNSDGWQGGVEFIGSSFARWVSCKKWIKYDFNNARHDY